MSGLHSFMPAFSCAQCGQFAFPEEGFTCYWCRNPNGCEEVVAAGVARAMAPHVVKTPEEVLDRFEQERIRLSKRRTRRKKGA